MKIVLTGGGSAGHVTPNIAIAEQLLARGDEVLYVGAGFVVVITAPRPV